MLSSGWLRIGCLGCSATTVYHQKWPGVRYPQESYMAGGVRPRLADCER